jgi:hypothetical protein
MEEVADRVDLRPRRRQTGPFQFAGFKFGPVLLQGSGTQDVDQAGKVVKASSAGTVTNFPYLGDGAYTYQAESGCFEAFCTVPGEVFGNFHVTSGLGSVSWLIDCRFTLHGGECGWQASSGTGAGAGIEGFAHGHISWIQVRGGHFETGFIAAVLSKTTEGG